MHVCIFECEMHCVLSIKKKRCTRLQKTLSLHQYCAPIQSRSEYNRQGYYWTRITHRYRHWNKSANALTPACIRTQNVTQIGSAEKGARAGASTDMLSEL